MLSIREIIVMHFFIVKRLPKIRHWYHQIWCCGHHRNLACYNYRNWNHCHCLIGLNLLDQDLVSIYSIFSSLECHQHPFCLLALTDTSKDIHCIRFGVYSIIFLCMIFQLILLLCIRFFVIIILQILLIYEGGWWSMIVITS